MVPEEPPPAQRREDQGAGGLQTAPTQRTVQLLQRQAAAPPLSHGEIPQVLPSCSGQAVPPPRPLVDPHTHITNDYNTTDVQYLYKPLKAVQFTLPFVPSPGCSIAKLLLIQGQL